MATGWAVGRANAVLDAELAAGPWIKLHVGEPGAAGTANAAVETTRKQATWNAATAGAASNSNSLSWTNVAGSETYTHWSRWSASTAGTFHSSGTVTAVAVAAGDAFGISASALVVTAQNIAS
jgi:hypothetical protein